MCRTAVDTQEELDSISYAVLATQLWLSEIMAGSEPRWLLLCGVSGNGKTHLARTAWKFLLRYAEDIHRAQRAKRGDASTNPETLFCYMQEDSMFRRWDMDLIDRAKSGDFYRLRRAKEDWIKIVDDLGMEQKEGAPGNERPTAFALGQMVSLIEGRIRKWSLFTSNYTRSGFAQVYDPRVADRFMRHPNQIVEIQARSFSVRQELSAKQAGVSNLDSRMAEVLQLANQSTSIVSKGAKTKPNK